MKRQIDTTDLRQRKREQFAKADLKRQHALVCEDPPSTEKQVEKSVLAGRSMQSEHNLLIAMSKKLTKELETSRSTRNWKDQTKRIWNHIKLYEQFMQPVDDQEDLEGDP